MKLLTKENIKQIPILYSQEKVDDPYAVVKFFDPTGGWSWYVIEGELQEDGDWRFFGLVKGFETELGYFHLSELESCKDGQTGMKALPIERDRLFTKTKISELK